MEWGQGELRQPVSPKKVGVLTTRKQWLLRGQVGRLEVRVGQAAKGPDQGKQVPGGLPRRTAQADHSCASARRAACCRHRQPDDW